MVKPVTKEFLLKNSIKIYAGSRQILQPDALYIEEPSELVDLPFFYVGEQPDTLLPSNIKISTSTSELRTLGFGVISKPVSEMPNYVKVKKGQNRVYLLKRTDEGDKTMEKLPKGMTWQYDRANERIRLMGPSVGIDGYTNWIPIHWELEQTQEKKFSNVYDIFANKDRILRKYDRDVLGIDLRDKMEIEDLPFGYTLSGQVACIPAIEPSKPDEPRIGVWGLTGFGKTLLIHGLIDRAMLYWGVRPSHWNDSQAETGEWCYPDENWGMDYGLGYNLNKLHEKPSAMPIIYLTPNTVDTSQIMHQEDGTGHRISLPFEEIVTNSHWYFDLQGSAKYFNSRAKDIKACETPEEAINVFATGDKELSYEDYKTMLKAKPPQIGKLDTPPDNSIQFVKAILEDLYQKKIVDKWCGVPSKWKVYQNNTFIGSFNPMIASLLCGVTPILETSDILTKNYFAQYFTYFARDLFNLKLTNPLFNNIRVWVFVDELGDIAKTNKATQASDILEQIQAKGRKRGIGTIVAQQNYTQVPEKIASNCRITFCFNTKESDKICYDLGLPKSVADDIKDLKRFEFMAYSKDHFVLYDMDGNKTITQGPIFCTLLPSLSTHSPPTTKKQGGK